MVHSVDTDPATLTSTNPVARVVAPLGERSFRWYFTGQLLSQIGDGVFVVAMPFVILRQGGGTLPLGVVLACYGVARLAALPIGGTIVDRLGARRVMVWSDVLRAVTVLLLAYLATKTHVPIWALIAFAIPFGCQDGLFQPASFAALPELVSDEQLPAANSLNATMQSTALIVGPAIGGVLVAGLASSSAFLLDALTFVASSMTLAIIGTRRPAARTGPTAAEPTSTPGSTHPVADADQPQPWTWHSVMRYVLNSPLLRMSLLITIVVNLAFGGMTEVALPDFSQSVLGGGARAFGVIMAGFGIGSIVGALFGEAFLRLRRRGLLALCLGVLQGVAIACAPVGSTLTVAVAAMVLAAAVQAVLNVFYVTMLQRDVPAGALGRVMSLMLACGYLAYPLSTVVSGAVSDATSPAVVIVAAGFSVSAAFAIGFVSRYYRNL